MYIYIHICMVMYLNNDDNGDDTNNDTNEIIGIAMVMIMPMKMTMLIMTMMGILAALPLGSRTFSFAIFSSGRFRPRCLRPDTFVWTLSSGGR